MSLNISETARARDCIGRPARRWLLRFVSGSCIAVAALTGSGCQLILNDIEFDDAGDGAPSEAEPDAANAEGAADASVHAANNDGGGGMSSIDAAGSGVEAGSEAPRTDAAQDAPGDTGSPDPDPGACDGAGERTFYRDADEDGQGDPDVRRTACEAPRGYVDNNRDCHDGNGDVFRGQTAFFADPYDVDGTTDSFDYDCNGRELGAPGSQPGQPCSTGGLLMCGGGGFEPNPDREARSGVNRYCGSNVILTCPNILPPLTGGCAGARTTTNEPFLCN